VGKRRRGWAGGKLERGNPAALEPKQDPHVGPVGRDGISRLRQELGCEVRHALLLLQAVAMRARAYSLSRWERVRVRAKPSRGRGVGIADSHLVICGNSPSPPPSPIGRGEGHPRRLGLNAPILHRAAHPGASSRERRRPACPGRWGGARVGSLRRGTAGQTPALPGGSVSVLRSLFPVPRPPPQPLIPTPTSPWPTQPRKAKKTTR